jgi:bacillithiol biosynthesis cysteine-adding enzyme BshC
VDPLPCRRVEWRNLPGIPSLFRDYVADFGRVAGFFRGNPREAGRFREAADAILAHPRPRAAVATILARQNAGLGAPPAALANAARLGEAGALAVLTGQQVGLFGGPLYTLYKALTAVRLAARLAAELGAPVVPVFWMAAEDHDLAEIDHAGILDASDRAQTIRVPLAPQGGAVLPANLRLDGAVQEAHAGLAAGLPPTAFRDEALAALAAAYAPGRTWAEAFGRWLAALVGRHGLVLVDPSDPEVKRLWAPLFAREVADAPRSSARLGEATAALRALGHHGPIGARADGLNLFLLDGQRSALRLGPGGVEVKGQAAPLARAELLALARQAPERLSPNVALRPVAQDSLFPTLAYVGGPAEVAYFAQLGGVYAHFGIPMPLVVPREGLTLLEGKVERLLGRHGLTLPDALADVEGLLGRLVARHLPPELTTALAEGRGAVEAAFARIEPLVRQADPTLEPTARQALGHVKGQLDLLEKKVRQALKRRSDELRGQAERLHAHCFPFGMLQERGLSPIAFLARYGPGLLDALLATIEGAGWDHRVVSLQALPGPPR